MILPVAYEEVPAVACSPDYKRNRAAKEHNNNVAGLDRLGPQADESDLGSEEPPPKAKVSSASHIQVGQQKRLLLASGRKARKSLYLLVQSLDALFVQPKITKNSSPEGLENRASSEVWHAGYLMD